MKILSGTNLRDEETKSLSDNAVFLVRVTGKDVKVIRDLCRTGTMPTQGERDVKDDILKELTGVVESSTPLESQPQ